MAIVSNGWNRYWGTESELLVPVVPTPPAPLRCQPARYEGKLGGARGREGGRVRRAVGGGEGGYE